ncbi:MAG: hypothetical protein JNM30_17135 [Rhodospirillales bacterium]|nr:hypothetical protein [Rhodospirillales bacterium]
MTNVPIYVLQVQIASKAPARLAAFRAALEQVCSEDTAFGFEIDSVDDNEVTAILKGLGEEQLVGAINRLRDFGVDCTVGAPEIAYRETVSRTVEHEHVYKNLVGPAGEFARMILRLEPLPRGEGFLFTSEAMDATLLPEHVAGVEKGINGTRKSGVAQGFPVTDVRVTLTDGAFHDQDSTAATFEREAPIAFRIAMLKAGPMLLEPIMRVEVVTPEDYAGSVRGDLTSRRGKITDELERKGIQVIVALVPLGNIFGYVNSLRSMTDGRGDCSINFERYEPVPVPDDLPDPDFPGAMALRQVG